MGVVMELGIVLIIAVTMLAVGFFVGFWLGRRSGLRERAPGFEVMPANRDLPRP